MTDWLLQYVTDRSRKADLLDVIDAMPDVARRGAPGPRRPNWELLKFIRAARAYHWDCLQAEKARAALDDIERRHSARRAAERSAARRQRFADLCRVNASEANEWLRSIGAVETGKVER